ncbi:MAG TPA: IS1182 family transposase [Acidobacteriaceae bacterium]|jgi:transposase/ribosomal protein L34|nr:IS1182 family transposase [Acidobacteriaceae bacterium]
MSGEELFPDLPIQMRREVEAGRPRQREPIRDQIELRAVDLEALVGPDHPARVIWAYVEKLDLQELEEAIRAREHTPGQAPASPRLLLALWLYATSEGIGSARGLARLCESHDVYRWLCGGVSVNYHGLADFRTAHPDLLERLLSENVATLSVAGVIDLDEVAQDGVRVRASAGTKSFRRRKKLHKELKKAQRLLERLQQETTDDPQASNRRIMAARERAAREREARVKAALEQMTAIEALRERRRKTNRKQAEKQKEPRASTTDPNARVMKMPDGGFRPAYNCQIASVAGGEIAIGTQVRNVGSDRGLARPMLEQIKQRHDRWPKRWLIDGGFNKNEDTEWAASHGVKIYGPPVFSKHNRDPYAPSDRDKPGVAAWRARMKSPHGKSVYKRRARAECINARFRNWGLYQFTVRGLEKVATILRWFALTNNILAGHRLLNAKN